MKPVLDQKAEKLAEVRNISKEEALRIIEEIDKLDTHVEVKEEHKGH